MFEDFFFSVILIIVTLASTFLIATCPLLWDEMFVNVSGWYGGNREMVWPYFHNAFNNNFRDSFIGFNFFFSMTPNDVDEFGLWRMLCRWSQTTICDYGVFEFGI